MASNGLGSMCSNLLCMCGSLIRHAVFGPHWVALCSGSTGSANVRPLMSLTPSWPTTAAVAMVAVLCEYVECGDWTSALGFRSCDSCRAAVWCGSPSRRRSRETVRLYQLPPQPLRYRWETAGRWQIERTSYHQPLVTVLSFLQSWSIRLRGMIADSLSLTTQSRLFRL